LEIRLCAYNSKKRLKHHRNTYSVISSRINTIALLFTFAGRIIIIINIFGFILSFNHLRNDLIYVGLITLGLFQENREESVRKADSSNDPNGVPPSHCLVQHRADAAQAAANIDAHGEDTLRAAALRRVYVIADKTNRVGNAAAHEHSKQNSGGQDLVEALAQADAGGGDSP
jgi:hypothetical protein